MEVKLSSEVQNLMRIAAGSEANVLITGPTGSGKTTLARKIHDGSARKGKPFIAVNLATLHEGTLESELFGHERGAFTSADQKRTGRLELAQGGTVFLDEVGELSPRLQARLLEFLQSRTISPVGSNREIRLDVRVIAATHRNLSLSVAKGEFREDLFYRLRVVSIRLKPLQERWEEFGELVHQCLADVCAQNRRSLLRISEDVAQKLEAYSWPGNIRELRNVLEYGVLASDGKEMSASDLPDWFHEQGTRSSAQLSAGGQVLGVADLSPGMDYPGAIAFFEREYLKTALSRYRGRINLTARRIGINKTTLIRRMRAYGLYPDSPLDGHGSDDHQK